MKQLKPIFGIVLCVLTLFPTACKINVNQMPRTEAIPGKQKEVVDTISNDPIDTETLSEEQKEAFDTILIEPADTETLSEERQAEETQKQIYGQQNGAQKIFPHPVGDGAELPEKPEQLHRKQQVYQQDDKEDPANA